jgi:FIMAH domain-containing protein
VFTVTVQVSDDHTTSTGTQTVTVISQAQAVRNALALVDQLAAAGTISHSGAIVLRVHLEAAARAFDSGKLNVATAVLRAALVELDVLVRIGQLSEADAAPLRALISRVILSVPS